MQIIWRNIRKLGDYEGSSDLSSWSRLENVCLGVFEDFWYFGSKNQLLDFLMISDTLLAHLVEPVAYEYV